MTNFHEFDVRNEGGIFRKALVNLNNLDAVLATKEPDIQWLKIGSTHLTLAVRGTYEEIASIVVPNYRSLSAQKAASLGVMAARHLQEYNSIEPQLQE